MVNTKKKNIRQEKGIRNAMGCGEFRVQFEQRLEASMQALSGGKAFQTAGTARAKALRETEAACLRITKEAIVFTEQSEPRRE